MSNFVWSTASLPGFKTDVQPPDNPSQQWAADDANRVFQALYDIRSAITGTSVNLLSFGAVGDGVTDDGPALQRALNFASASIGGVYGSFVQVPKGVFCISSVDIPNGVGIKGAGPSASVLRATGSFSGSSLVRNLLRNGTQEFAFIESIQIDGNSGNGAICGAVVEFTSLFVNSYIRDVLIVNGSNVGLYIGSSGSPGGSGPIYVENTWVVSNTGHNIMVEEVSGNLGAMMGICFTSVYSEHQGSNASALYLKGRGNASQWNFTNMHFEQGNPATGRTCITLDGVAFVKIDGVQVLATSGTVSEVVKITSAIQNVGFQIGPIYNSNLVSPVIRDQKNGVTIAAPTYNIRSYVTPDFGIMGGQRFTPSTGSGSKSIVAQDSNGVDRAWFDEFGALSGTSALGGASLDISGDRPLVLLTRDRSRAFGWTFPDASNFRLRYFSGGADLLNFDNSGNGFVYQPMTFQFGVKGQASRSAAPSAGTHAVGEIVFNQDPVSSGFIGWVCVTGGLPGTWKAWGAIGA